MGHTLAEGIAQITWDGALIALGDMPGIMPATFCKAATTMVQGGICQATWQGKPGHPVGFSSAWFEQLGQLQGDTGARGIIKQHGEAVTHFPVDDPGILRDIDTPADLLS
jgi:molybdenum cofactor cytidylyltransferase